MIKLCPKCNIEHKKPGTYCSRICANSRLWTNEDKLKKSVAAKSSLKVKSANSNRKCEYVCTNCKAKFGSERKRITKDVFCSNVCCGKYRQLERNKLS